MRKGTKKLEIKAETLRELSAKELRTAVGGNGGVSIVPNSNQIGSSQVSSRGGCGNTNK
jgi:hypothetical protein